MNSKCVLKQGGERKRVQTISIATSNYKTQYTRPGASYGQEPELFILQASNIRQKMTIESGMRQRNTSHDTGVSLAVRSYAWPVVLDSTTWVKQLAGDDMRWKVCHSKEHSKDWPASHEPPLQQKTNGSQQLSPMNDSTNCLKNSMRNWTSLGATFFIKSFSVPPNDFDQLCLLSVYWWR